MNRVERLKEVKTYKRRFIYTAILFFSILIIGISIVDYSFNSLMKNEKRIEVVSFNSINSSYIEISFMNKKFGMNTKFIKRDFENLKSEISKLINFW